jgi:hypothetical protein
VTGVVAGEGGQVGLGQALLARAHVGVGDRSREVGVALGVSGEDQEVPPAGVGGAGLRPPWEVEGELGAEDRGHLQGLRRLGEPDDPVEAVVVGDGQGGQVQSRRLLDQLLGMRGAVEEAEVGVAVQLGIGDGARPPADVGCLVLPTLVRPGRAVPPVRVVRPAGQSSLQLGPRHGRVGPTHGSECSEHTFAPCPEWKAMICSTQ